MQFTFSKTDSVYTIYKSIQKCSRVHPRVTIRIVDDHPLFTNTRRGNQIKTMCEQKGIALTGIATGPLSEAYYASLDIPFTKDNTHQSRRVKHRKRYKQRRTTSKRSPLTIGFVMAEVIIMVIIIRMVILLVTPSATVTIVPTINRERYAYSFHLYPAQNPGALGEGRLHIPYQTATARYTIDTQILVNPTIIGQTPATGSMEITNNGTTTFAGVIANTRFVAPNDTIVRVPQAIPAIAPGGSVTVPVVSAEINNLGAIQGADANLPANTMLQIRNLPNLNGIVQGRIVADMSGGSVEIDPIISQENIDNLQTRLDEEATELINTLPNDFFSNDHIIVRNTDDIQTFITYEPVDFRYTIDEASTDEPNAQRIATGYLTVDITYTYIQHDDVTRVIDRYIRERGSPNTSIFSIDYDSFFISSYTPISNQIFKIPSSFYVIEGYNFSQDNQGIIASILPHITGLPVEEARQILRDSSPTIRSVQITNQPQRSTTMPQLQTRIDINIQQP